MDLTELGRWTDHLSPDPQLWDRLSTQVEAAYATTTVYPPRETLFAALRATPPSEVRAVILGQDPYHQPGQAHGLSFSVEPGTPIPKSLGNIYRELQSDLGLPIPETGCLLPWAQQGVLLLNSVLTVEHGKAGSHRAFGWESFTDSIITATNDLPQPIAFVLWGNFAIKKAPLITSQAPRLVLTAPHPSPLSAYRGFFGSRPFSQINDFLRLHGEPEIDWRL
jgi:uracil-DNA glycosylase